MPRPSDLTKEEQTNVRTALRFLRSRCGGWMSVAKALRFGDSTLSSVMSGKAVSASLAVRVARLASVAVDDVLSGKYPAPGTCPYCGHRPNDSVDETPKQLQAKQDTKTELTKAPERGAEAH